MPPITVKTIDLFKKYINTYSIKTMHPFLKSILKGILHLMYDSTRHGSFLNITEKLQKSTPNSTTITLVSEESCISKGDEIVD